MEEKAKPLLSGLNTRSLEYMNNRRRSFHPKGKLLPSSGEARIKLSALIGDGEEEYTLDQMIEEIAKTVGIAKAVRRFFLSPYHTLTTRRRYHLR